MKNRRKIAAVFLFLFCSGFLIWSQTMYDLPRMILKPFGEISTAAKEENLGETIKTIFQTAFDRSLALQVPETENLKDFSLANLKKIFAPTSPKKVFLLDAYCLKFVDEIQVDLRVHDVFTGSLLETFFLKVNSFHEVREAVITLVRDIELALFRDVLSTLKLTTVPGACDIYLDGRYLGKTDSQAGSLTLNNLIPGTYNLRALAVGFTDYEDTLLLRPRHITNFSAALALEPGILVIDSVPRGASISIDGKDMGQTPRKFDQIEPGEYNIVLRADNYKPWEHKLLIESRQEKNISATLEIMPGSLNLSSEPGGASIYYGESQLGQTPLIEYNLEPGKYLLEFRLENYNSKTVSAVVNPGQETKYELALERQMGELTFITTPAGADVYLTPTGGEKKLVGQTPLEKVALAVGDYVVSFQKDGFYTEDFGARCRNGDIEVLSRDLLYIPGSIRIETKPAQANIYVDNIYRGVSPVEVLELPPGYYNIVARTAYGYTTEEVTVEADKVTEIKLEVEKPATGFLSGVILAAISLLAYFSILGS